MSKIFPGYFPNIYQSICKATAPVITAVNDTIALIARYNLKLIALSLVCAYYHDYNIVLVYGFIGVVFHNQIDEVSETVCAIFKAAFTIIETALRPLLNHKLFNYNLGGYHFNPLKGALYGAGIFTYFFLSPISLISTQFLLVANCGANIARISREIIRGKAPSTSN